MHVDNAISGNYPLKKLCLLWLDLYLLSPKPNSEFELCLGGSEGSPHTTIWKTPHIQSHQTYVI